MALIVGNNCGPCEAFEMYIPQVSYFSSGEFPFFDLQGEAVMSMQLNTQRRTVSGG